MCSKRRCRLAPKRCTQVRALEIIDEFEPEKRGIFGGAVGYLSWQGSMDTAIAIRTAIVKDGWLNVQAGAGIVADSVPELEWMETLNKAGPSCEPRQSRNRVFNSLRRLRTP